MTWTAHERLHDTPNGEAISGGGQGDAERAAFWGPVATGVELVSDGPALAILVQPQRYAEICDHDVGLVQSNYDVLGLAICMEDTLCMAVRRSPGHLERKAPTLRRQSIVGFHCCCRRRPIQLMLGKPRVEGAAAQLHEDAHVDGVSQDGVTSQDVAVAKLGHVAELELDVPHVVVEELRREALPRNIADHPDLAVRRLAEEARGLQRTTLLRHHRHGRVVVVLSRLFRALTSGRNHLWRHYLPFRILHGLRTPESFCNPRLLLLVGHTGPSMSNKGRR